MFKIKKLLDWGNLDKTIFFTAIPLVLIGFLVFFSASIGFLNKSNSEVYFLNFVKTQTISLFIGFVALVLGYLISIKKYLKYIFIVYGLSITLGLLVFVPGIGLTHGGATRWLNVLGFTIQPADFIKFGAIFAFSYYLFLKRATIRELYDGLINPVILLIPVLVTFFLQKDLGTLLIIFFTIFVIYFCSKAPAKFWLSAIGAAMILISLYAYFNPYVKQRIMSYTKTQVDDEGISYQSKQSLISLALGGVEGKGYGQGIQKFYYLPEPAGDSIFVVAGEELGFIGLLIILILFFTFISRVFWRAFEMENEFYRSLLLGFGALFFIQLFVNVGSVVGIIPLSGDTLPFFSKGGTAIIMNMLELGIILQLTKRKSN
jgi:cell division protein FtsW